MLEQRLHDRQREMVTLAAEKRQIELLYLKQKQNVQQQPRFGDLFNGKESLDIPTKMRAIVEDNRGMKEKCRKLKSESVQRRNLNSELNTQNQLIQAQLRETRQRLSQCDITPEEMDDIQVFLGMRCNRIAENLAQDGGNVAAYRVA